MLRGLGWDIDSSYSSNRGELYPIGSYGHTGFTGTSVWIDPSTKSYVILLTNVVHPNARKESQLAAQPPGDHRRGVAGRGCAGRERRRATTKHSRAPVCGG